MDTPSNEDSSSDWAIKSVVQDVGEPMDALCTNKTFDLIAVAGRSLMKLFSLKNNEFKYELDLRSKTRRANLYFSGSVSWNPVNPIVAAASSTGLIVLFDLEGCRNSQDSNPTRFIDPDGPSNVDQYFRTNKAAGTKVCFHSYDPNLLVSGSRDTTIRLYDIRYDKPVASFGTDEYSIIRDLQFCLDRQHENYFVTGGDNGTVRFWDIRQSSTYLKKFSGNTNSVAIALHPNGQYWNSLATAGQDGFIQVWDWATDKPEALHKIVSPAPINRVEWDPLNPTNIATTTANHDHQLLIWSYNRPYFPIVSFRGHSSSSKISDMAFPHASLGENKVITCAKDKKLILHFVEYGDATVENTIPISMSTGPYNEIIASFPKEYSTGNTVAEFDYSRPIESSVVHYSDELLPPFNDTENLVNLAKAYKFSGDNPVRICNWNAHVNKQLGNFSLAYTWKVIGIVIQQADIFKPQQSNIPEDPYFEYISPNKPKKEQIEKEEDDGEFSDADSGELTFEAGAFCQKFQETLSLETDLFFNSKEFQMSSLPGGGRFLDFIQQKHDALMRSDLGNINEEAVLASADSIDDESDEGSELDARSSASDQQQMSSAEEQDSIDMRSNSPTLRSTPESAILETESNASVSSEVANWVDEQKIENYFSASLNNGSDNWGPLTMLKHLINAYADIGDSQTCATVCLILGKLANQMFGDDQINVWFFHYIEMLQDAGCIVLATFMAKQCASEEVIRVIQENMHVKFFCANCSTAAPSGMTSCPKCKIVFATVCTVCDHEVKGLFSQCNSCGHGGHYQHLEEWFKNFGICPFPGCLHVCVQAEARKGSEDETVSGEFKNRKLNPYGHIFYDIDDQSYYRDEDGSMRKLSCVDERRRKPNKYSLD